METHHFLMMAVVAFIFLLVGAKNPWIAGKFGF